MNSEILLLSAYHESGRIVFTYLNGYTCDSMELSDIDSGRGGSKLNAGQDLPIVQAVLTGNALSLSPENKERGVEVAKKLMAIYCAGTCAVAFYENGKNIPAEINLEIPGHDLRNIELIQKFLKGAVPGHPENYPSQAIAIIFQKMKEPEAWKAIENLANKAFNSEKKSLTQFYIADSLMASGMKVRSSNAIASDGQRTSSVRKDFALDLQEDKEPAKRPAPESNLEIILKDYLMQIKKDWKDGELEAASDHVRSIFKKHG